MNMNTTSPKKIFIGHGRNPIWRELKEFIQDRLKLTVDEFNTESVAGKTQQDRLSSMLGGASFAFLIMTGEDKHSDGTLHARENVIHEIGLFQGRLNFAKAIILLEDGCTEFSNVNGLTHISFPPRNIEAAFEKIRQVLEREGVLKPKLPVPNGPRRLTLRSSLRRARLHRLR